MGRSFCFRPPVHSNRGDRNKRTVPLLFILHKFRIILPYFKSYGLFYRIHTTFKYFSGCVNDQYMGIFLIQIYNSYHLPVFVKGKTTYYHICSISYFP